MFSPWVNEVLKIGACSQGGELPPERSEMKLKLAALALAAIATVPATAIAQGQNCSQREAVVERLSTKYGESRQSIGMAPKGRVVEVYASHETGTWTITVTMPNGITCLVASGQSFETLDEPIEPAGIRS